MPTGKETLIQPAKEEVVAIVKEETQTAPTSLDVATSQMAPLSPLKVKRKYSFHLIYGIHTYCLSNTVLNSHFS